MKIAFVILLAVALCAHVSVVTCATSTVPTLTGSLFGTTSTTTTKPWTQRFKDGLGKFLQGAAIAGAVQQGFQNARSHKHKPSLASAAKSH
ncbi:hypothetical protein SFRURICE_008659 [Spodoptera frugiperda]|nr:hypothetical protein SFRURICE_008659 [Spodoptera frugiperda]